MANKFKRDDGKRVEVILYPDKDDDIIAFFKKQSYHKTSIIKLGLRELISKYGKEDLAKSITGLDTRQNKRIEKKESNSTASNFKKQEKTSDSKPASNESNRKVSKNSDSKKKIVTNKKHKRLPQSVFEQWDNQNFDNL